jgi:hypothetical protein
MTDTTIKAWGSIELAVKTLLTTSYDELVALGPDADARVGGDFDFSTGGGWYIRLGLVDSRSDRFGGSFTFDLETWGDDYLDSESRANRLDALVLGYPHVVEVDGSTWVFDTVSQNTGPRELPWEDDAVTRLGATYVITARRR